jgi:tRNA-specific adenosine deaminase 3
LFNHSATPNVSYTLHPETLTIHYQTTRPVATWEELCICYGDKLWFEDANAGAQDRIAGGRDGGRGREAKIRMKDEDEHEDDDTEESVLQALMAIELGETQEQEEQEEEEDEGMLQTHMKSNNT